MDSAPNSVIIISLAVFAGMRGRPELPDVQVAADCLSTDVYCLFDVTQRPVQLARRNHLLLFASLKTLLTLMKAIPCVRINVPDQSLRRRVFA